MINKELECLVKDIKLCVSLFDIDNIKQELNSLYSNTTYNKDVSKRVNELLQTTKIIDELNEMEIFCLLIDSEEDQESFVEDVSKITERLKTIKAEKLLNGIYDKNPAVLTINSGSGGTESQSWTKILLEMYCKWCNKHKYNYEILDIQQENELISSVTIVINNSVYGLLKSEIGVHRLIRISPYNSQGKRMTSFASVFVYPLIEEETELEINQSDLRIDTFRSSGNGGQSVNTTDSAVRITHMPTGIVVSCQNEKSQIGNKKTAMKMLKSRLLQLEEEKKNQEKQKMEDSKTVNGWGNQIRTYTFQPYQLVKDHRTKFENSNLESVLSGNIDKFIEEYIIENAK